MGDAARNAGPSRRALAEMRLVTSSKVITKLTHRPCPTAQSTRKDCARCRRGRGCDLLDFAGLDLLAAGSQQLCESRNDIFEFPAGYLGFVEIEHKFSRFIDVIDAPFSSTPITPEDTAQNHFCEFCALVQIITGRNQFVCWLLIRSAIVLNVRASCPTSSSFRYRQARALTNHRHPVSVSR